MKILSPRFISINIISQPSKRKRIELFYVIAPANVTTGGPELLHQLVYELNQMDLDAVIAYDRRSKNNMEPSIPQQYKRYVSEFITADSIPDTKDSYVVIPETRPFYVKQFKNATTIFWWLSVDFFKIQCDPKYKFENQGIPQAIKALMLQTKKRAFASIKKAPIHLYQSEYARQYAISHGIAPSALIKLSDYVNDDYRTGIDYLSFSNRKQNVLYNPKKGRRYTEQLIKLAPNLHWIPLQGYTNQQLVSLMKESMLYIDFGFHPGKDRLPREAAACGTCVITGKQGAAAFENDYPIPEWASINQADVSPIEVVQTIKHVLNNYEQLIEEFSPYRSMIKGEKEVFKADLQTFVHSINGLEKNADVQ